jgi:hypothetical protein
MKEAATTIPISEEPTVTPEWFLNNEYFKLKMLDDEQMRKDQLNLVRPHKHLLMWPKSLGQ